MRLARPAFARSLVTASITAALGFTTLPAFAATDHAHPHNPAAISAPNATAAEARQKAYDHTQALMSLQKRWAKAQGAEKSRALEKMVAKAEERRAFLLQLMESNPAAVLSAAIPDAKQLGMPTEVVQKLEQKVELEGDYEARYEDFADGTHKLRQYVRTPFGERFELHKTNAAFDLNTGAKIRARGLLVPSSDNSELDGNFALDSGEDSLENIAYLGSTSTSSTQSFPSDTFGEQKTLVMLVNFQDNKEQPYSRAFAQNMIFGDVSEFMRENSYGQTWLSGDVTNWTTLPISGSSCDTGAIRDNADAAAQAQGFDLSAYTRLVYVFPKISCGWSGSGQVGGTQTRAWINGIYDLHTLAHELGHNFGLRHSSSLACSDGSIVGAGTETSTSGNPWSNCIKAEYGDEADVMGDSPSAHYNAAHKDRLGWLNYGSSPTITEVTESGSYQLGVLADQASASLPKALKVLKSQDPSTGKKNWYYVEFRQPTGFDSIISAPYADGNDLQSDNVLNGVLIHAQDSISRSFLLDMTPETYEYYHRDPALTVGNTFVSPDNVSFTTEWTDNGKAVVNVRFDGTSTPICAPASPSLTFAPAEGPWVAAGTAVSYTVTVTNNDSSACANSSYSLNASSMSSWSSRFGNTSLSIAPGNSASTTLTLTSPGSATDGFYDISVTATSGAYSAQGNVTYVVDNPTTVNSAPVANNDSASISTATTVTIDVLSNDSDPDGDALTIVGITQGSKGSVRLNSNGTLTYTPAKSFKNSDSFSYTISDGKRSASASVSISAASSGSTGGKGNGKGSNK